VASWYGTESNSRSTALGEQFDLHTLTAAHPRLPIPSYVRITNLANGHQLVVCVNDRGPYTKGRIIDLSKAAADRLNLTNNIKVKADFIRVAQDGTLSGPGTTVEKQSYALLARPVDNSGLNISDNAPGNNSRSGFHGVPGTVRDGSTSKTAVDAALTSDYWVQVGALSNVECSQRWQQRLSQQFGVPGKIAAGSSIYPVQTGPFSSRQQAVQLQQRLSNEAQQYSFIIATLTINYGGTGLISAYLSETFPCS